MRSTTLIGDVLRFTIHRGIVPVKWLLLIFRDSKTFRGTVGRVPVKLLFCNSNESKDRLKCFEKISPWKLLLDNLKKSKEMQLVINSIGTSLEKWLKDKSKAHKLLMSPIEDGRLPSNWFWDKFRYSNFGIHFPIFSWSFPSKWLSETSNQRRFM